MIEIKDIIKGVKNISKRGLHIDSKFVDHIYKKYLSEYERLSYDGHVPKSTICIIATFIDNTRMHGDVVYEVILHDNVPTVLVKYSGKNLDSIAYHVINGFKFGAIIDEVRNASVLSQIDHHDLDHEEILIEFKDLFDIDSVGSTYINGVKKP